MTKGNHRLWVILLLACVLLLGAGMLPLSLLPASDMLVSHAQDATSTPAPTVESTPDAAATPQVDATPQADVTPEAGATAGATATPGVDVSSSIEEVASELVSGIEELTWQEALKLLLWVVVIVVAVIWGSRLVYALLRLLAKRTPTTFDDALLEAIRLSDYKYIMSIIG